MRNGKSPKRELLPDPKFGDVMVTRFTNSILLQGEKNKAYQAFYKAIDEITVRTKENGLDVFKRALNNVMPLLEVKSRRVGGANFQIPLEVRPDRSISMGIKWLVSFARQRKGRTISDKLVEEIIAASKNEGAAVKKKEDTHKMAEANKAFAHFKF